MYPLHLVVCPSVRLCLHLQALPWLGSSRLPHDRRTWKHTHEMQQYLKYRYAFTPTYTCMPVDINDWCQDIVNCMTNFVCSPLCYHTHQACTSTERNMCGTYVRRACVAHSSSRRARFAGDGDVLSSASSSFAGSAGGPVATVVPVSS